MLTRLFRRKQNESTVENTTTEYCIDKDRVPRHIAIIMDGNGRWAQNRGMPRSFGHRAGVEALRDTVKTCSELGVKALTVYAFSTENWKRPTEEISTLMGLLIEYLQKEVEELHKQRVQVRFIGDTNVLSASVREEIARARARTGANQGLILNIAVNYGGRAEILNAVKRIHEDISDGNITAGEVDETLFARYLSTADTGDPELLIRPSGDFRISNFLLWQLAYTEFWFCEVLWPDFSRDHLIQAISDYQRRDRRFGGISNKNKV